MKLNADIFIPVRLSSQRLPSKHLKLVNGEPVILKLIRRLEKSKKIRKIIVCTTTHDSDEPLIEILEKQSILYFRGDKNDIINPNVVKVHTGQTLKDDDFFDAKDFFRIKKDLNHLIMHLIEI